MDRDIGSREMSDDDDADTVSVTSTATSEKKDTYPLEGILAERENSSGETEYLVKWEGYPEERNTWEIRENFQDDQTLLEWGDQKMRITRGHIKPFDLEAFEERIEKYYAARDKRKRRRYYKRIRLGLPVDPLQIEDAISDEYDELEEAAVERQPAAKRRRRLKRRASMSPESVAISTDSDSVAFETERSSEAVEPPVRQWSSKEQNALMNGLERANAPRYEAILEMHALTLKDFTVSDLEAQARLLKKGWKESGREIPQCLQLIPDKAAASKAPTIRPRKQSSRKEVSGLPLKRPSYDEASDTSTDSLMQDLQRKNSAKSAKKDIQENGYKPPKSAPTTVAKRTEDRRLSSNHALKLPSDVTTIANKARPPGDIRSTEGKGKEPPISGSKATPSIQPVQATSTVPAAVAAKPGLARAAPAPAAQMAVPGRGPRRDPPSRTSPITSKKKRHVSGPTVLSNWDPKEPHRNSSLALKKQTSTDITKKAWDKHSIRRRAVKKGRTEPAPDMSKLQLLNLKDGKAVKDPAAVTTAQEYPTKTPYQLLQERERRTKEQNKPAPAESTAHDTSWMDQIDEEILLDTPSNQASTTQAEQPPSKASKPAPQAPQALMKFADEKERPKRRASMPLSAYKQRSQLSLATSEPHKKASAPSLPNPDELLSQSPHSAHPRSNHPVKATSAALVASEHTAPLEPMRSSYNRVFGGNFDVPGTRDISDVFAYIHLGAERTEIPSVTWRGLDPPAKRAFIGTVSGKRPVWFSQICTAADYKARFDQNTAQIFGAGYVVPRPQQAATINDLAGFLTLHVAGAFFHATDFTLLAYPVSTEDWAFLDDRLPHIPSNQIQLRFIIRTLIQDVGISRAVPDVLKSDLEKKLVKKGQAINIPGESDINTVMRILYSISYQRLIQQAPPHKSSESARFFLLFPKEAKDEHDLVLQFLDTNQALEIYSYDEDRNDSVWPYFCHNVECGVLIVHSSFWHFHQMPNITYVLRKPINIWTLNLRKDKNMGKRHLTRLFPHGCVLLLTDSLILLQPLEAVRILSWFRLKMLVEKPAGTWKIVTRPGLRNFCLNCCNERKDDEEGKRFVQIYQELVYMLDPDELYDYEEDAPKKEAPIYFMGKIKAFNTKVGRRVDYDRDLDHKAIAQNDEILTEFFAGWASCHIEDYRRFHVISGFGDTEVSAAKEHWADKCSFLEFFTPPNFHVRYKVSSQSSLDDLRAQKHDALMAEYDRRDAELEKQAKRDAEEARKQAETRAREWDAMCAQKPGLREAHERLQSEVDWSEWDAAGRKAVEEEEEEKEEKEWDEWSRDNESVMDVDVGVKKNRVGSEASGEESGLSDYESVSSSESE